MALLCLPVKGLLHLWCYNHKNNNYNNNNNNNRNIILDKANLHFVYHKTPKLFLDYCIFGSRQQYFICFPHSDTV